MMKIHTLFRVLMVLGIAGMFGCGGGSSSPATNTPTPPTAPSKSTTTISGKVEFPSLSSLVAKRVNAVADPVNVQAYTIDGVAFGSQVAADAFGNFTISGLDSGVDYVLKATRGPQVLKKLIEKMTVAPGATVPDQDISGVSTTAVAVASQKLATAAGSSTFNLGEPVTLNETQKTALSAMIFTDISPKELETTITIAAATVQAAISAGELSTLSKFNVDLINTLNIVVAAVSSNTDPTQVINGQVQNFTVATDSTAKQLRLLEISVGGIVTQAVAITSVSSAAIAPTVASSVVAYSPPSRVQLEISSNVAAGTMNGITLDITIPAGAMPKLLAASADGKSYAVDLKSVSLAADVAMGTIVYAQFTTASRDLRVIVAVGNDNSFLQPGKLVTILFDRTVGVVVSNNDFTTKIVKAIDLNGNPLPSGFALTNTVTASGL